MVERRLRCRTIELGRSVEPADLDEYRPGLLGAAPPHRRECSLGMAAPNIGRHPDRRLETHWPKYLRVPRKREPVLTVYETLRHGPRLRLRGGMLRGHDRKISVQRTAGHGGKLARQTVGNLARHRQLAFALEALDRHPGLSPQYAGRPHLTVAE